MTSRYSYDFTAPLAESKLPSGTPGGKGVPLRDDIPGSKTYSQPEESTRNTAPKDESIYRVDQADDLVKDQSQPDQIDHSQAKPSSYGLGESYETGKTKYPYRDGIPNAHNAAMVAEMWLARQAHELRLVPGVKVKVAAKLSEILEGLNPKVQQRASACKASLKRVDVANLRWILSVDCGNGPKVVNLKATRKGNVAKLSKMDLMVACSCPAWKWLGPEHHAVQGTYLDREPKGTASVPFVRDPQSHNLVCKHVACALNLAQGWDIPVKPKSKKK